MAREIKVGDKVRNVSDGPSNWGHFLGAKMGDICTVEAVRPSRRRAGEILLHLAEYSSGSPVHLRCARHYELIEEAPFDLFGAMTGAALKFRSGCDVKFIAYAPDAKPHCQLVLLNPSTGNIVTRYANGKASDEPHNDPGDILLREAA
ncbi:MAG: hypothetical protein VB138_10910 [Burkholderia sp.]